MKKTAGDKRDLERSRKRILDAAAKEFAEKGLAGARVDTIASRSGVSKAMIYYIFGGKDELHLAVIESLFQEKSANQAPFLLKEDITAEDCAEMVRVSLGASLRRKEYVRIMLHDVATGGNALRRLKKKRPDLFVIFESISERLRASMKRKKARETDPDKSVMMFVLVITALSSMLPHMDLARGRGSTHQKDLSDASQWEDFLADVVGRILGIGPVRG